MGTYEEIMNLLENGKLIGTKKNPEFDLMEVLYLNKKFSEWCNCFCLDKYGLIEAFLESKKATEVMTNIAMAWLLALKFQFKNEYLYDKRNEYSVKTALRYLSVPEIEKLVFSLYGDFQFTESRNLDKYYWNRAIKKEKEKPYMGIYFAVLMSGEHRTIQQSFSSFIFSLIEKIVLKKNPKKVSHEFAELTHAGAARCPLV